jgi:hypothetical protein
MIPKQISEIEERRWEKEERRRLKEVEERLQI